MTTIYDVAKEAGVSPKTVSRVLNGDEPVNVKTREKVQKTIDALGYRPSQAARLMRTSKSGLIGLITTAISNTSDVSDPTGLPDIYLVQGVQQVMAKAGKTVMISDTMGDSAKIPELIQTFEQYQVEGILYVADFHKKLETKLRQTQCPIVMANCFDEQGTSAIIPDDEAGQYALVQRLIEVGHRRIAYFSLPAGMEAARLRVAGYKSALCDAGIKIDENLIFQGFNMSLADRVAPLGHAIDSVMGLDEPPSVICCGNDEMALRVYGLLRKRGLNIPEQISVTGYDNYRAIAEVLVPALTTVELPYSEMGRQAATQLLEMIEAGDFQHRSEGPKRVSGPVVWRSSVTSHNHVHNS